MGNFKGLYEQNIKDFRIVELICLLLWNCTDCISGYSDVMFDLIGLLPKFLTRTVHKVLMRRVLSDKYKITQEKFQYHGA